MFENLRVGPFLTNPDDRMRLNELKYHFDEITRRFVFSLQQLNDLMQRLAAEFDRGPMSMHIPKITFEAGCQADHVLSYLNSMLDDIAHCIMFATGYVSPDPKRPVDSLSALKSKGIRSTPSLVSVAPLLVELDAPTSWWGIGFERQVGARQLLIHNQHFVSFQGAKSPGCPMEAQAFLVSPSGRTPTAGNFFVLLREILTKLCDWLDRLDNALTALLPHQLPPAYWPKDYVPRIPFPLGHPMNGIRYVEEYFPLPICDGSDPLPWGFAPPTFEGSKG